MVRIFTRILQANKSLERAKHRKAKVVQVMPVKKLCPKMGERALTQKALSMVNGGIIFLYVSVKTFRG